MRAFATVVLSATAVLSAQTPESPPIPYVASVKVNASGSPSSFTRRLPGGTFLASNMTAHDMIAFAHGLQPFQVEGGPDWIRMVRFDITIRAETNVGPVAIGPTQIGLQRAVLAERFAFQAHRETRERPVFALVRARTDGAPGPRIRQSKTDCARSRAPPVNLRPGRRDLPRDAYCAVCRRRETRSPPAGIRCRSSSAFSPARRSAP